MAPALGMLGIAILVTVLGQVSGAGALPAFQRATVVLASTAAGAGPGPRHPGASLSASCPSRSSRSHRVTPMDRRNGRS